MCLTWQARQAAPLLPIPKHRPNSVDCQKLDYANFRRIFMLSRLDVKLIKVMILKTIPCIKPLNLVVNTGYPPMRINARPRKGRGNGKTHKRPFLKCNFLIKPSDLYQINVSLI